MRAKRGQQQHSDEPAPASDLCRLNQSRDPGDDCGNAQDCNSWFLTTHSNEAVDAQWAYPLMQ